MNIAGLLLRLLTALGKLFAKSKQQPLPPFRLGADLASRIVKAMLDRGYSITTDPGTFNLVYVEGMDVDGTLNKNRFNAFDDFRAIIRCVKGLAPEIVHIGDATTEPGKFWTDNRMNPAGAFH